MMGLAGIINIFLLMLFSNNPLFLVTRITQLLGIGSLPNISLVVTETGCGILSIASNGNLCQPVINQSIYITEPLILQSRIGKDMRIQPVKNEFSIQEFKDRTTAIVLPASEVLGWKEER